MRPSLFFVKDADEGDQIIIEIVNCVVRAQERYSETKVVVALQLPDSEFTHAKSVRAVEVMVRVNFELGIVINCTHLKLDLW